VREATASVEVGSKNYRVFDGSQELPSQKYGSKLVFNACEKGLGFRSYELKEKSVETNVEESTSPYYFENDVMSVIVLPDGRIGSIKSKLTGERLKAPGNLLKGKLTREDRSEKWITNENAAKTMKVEKGPVYDKITINGMIDDISYDLVIKLPHGARQKIDFALDLGFKNHEIGDFYHDESKLNIYWYLDQQESEIAIDEPFGWTWQRADRPLHAANFVGLFEKDKGLVFQHSGMPKSWVSGGAYANVIAWGATNFTNRTPWGWNSFNIFDMRLDRKCHYDYSVSIAENKNMAAIVKRISGDITPFVAVQSAKAVESKSLLTVKNDNLIITAVEQKDEVIAVRLYDASGKASVPEFETVFKLIAKTDVAGKKADFIGAKPFEVFELTFK
jgi:hypothetical protein